MVFELVAVADASHAKQATDRKPVSGGVITCAGNCVCWYLRTHMCVTLSTTEIEGGILYHYSNFSGFAIQFSGGLDFSGEFCGLSFLEEWISLMIFVIHRRTGFLW